MTYKDLLAIILSEASGLDLKESFLLINRSDPLFLDPGQLRQKISYEKALIALDLWNRNKARIAALILCGKIGALGKKNLS